jgi:hypothetical protein
VKAVRRRRSQVTALVADVEKRAGHYAATLQGGSSTYYVGRSYEGRWYAVDGEDRDLHPKQADFPTLEAAVKAVLKDCDAKTFVVGAE